MNKTLEVQVIKENDLYHFDVRGYIGSYKIYYSSHRELNNKREIAIGNRSEIMVKVPEENTRLFFFIEDEGGQNRVCATRLVDVESIDNFRDIGGYKTRDGKYVKWGYFYRCANLGKMTQRDQQYLENIQLRTVFDLRSQMEVTAEQDVIPNGCQYRNHSGIVTMDDTLSGQGNFDMKTLMIELMKNPQSIEQFSNFLIEGYRTMAVSSSAFNKLFEEIKEKQCVPLVFHCSAGKDRTGIGAAFILLALGVDEETVIADYCLSNSYREEINKKQVEALSEFVKDQQLLALIKEMLEVKEEYIRMTLDTIHEQYGSFEIFLEQALGVSQSELEQLKNKYLY